MLDLHAVHAGEAVACVIEGEAVLALAVHQFHFTRVGPETQVALAEVHVLRRLLRREDLAAAEAAGKVNPAVGAGRGIVYPEL